MRFWINLIHGIKQITTDADADHNCDNLTNVDSII